jgi:hypothetical protein
LNTSWEQGVTGDAIAELDYPEYSYFGYDKKTMKPLPYPNRACPEDELPLLLINIGTSASVRQSPEGRLSQEINEGTDGASLDGASAGPSVLAGKC